MFYKVVQAESITKLDGLVEDLLHQGWILADWIAFDGQNYVQAMTRQ